MRLNHIKTFPDVARGKQFAPRTLGEPVVTFKGRKLYHVNKGARPMTFIYALGNHVFDIRDVANVHAPDSVAKVSDPESMSELAVRAVLFVAEPYLQFPRRVR